MRSHFISLGYIPGYVPATQNIEIVQDKETLSRRFRHPRDFISPDVFDGDRYAGLVLLLRDYRDGIVRRIRYAKLLQVSAKLITIIKKSEYVFFSQFSFFNFY